MSNARTCTAIIPARGGSKGVPRKNARPLAGRPLVAHAIDSALRAERVDEVIVSTDDAEIAAIALRYGAKVIDRPPELSGDAASSESALLHALEVLEADGALPDLVMMIQCTSPLTTASDLDGVIERLESAKAESCFTAVPFFHFLWSEAEDGSALGVNHDGGPRKRRQDLRPSLLEDGAAYVMDVAAFRREGTRFCGRTVAFQTDPRRALEIDEPVDFTKAEAVVRALEADARAERLPAHPAAVVFDFDGVFTDNKVIVREDGIEAVVCSRGDGMGLGLLAARGVPLLILSKERNPVVTARAAKLRIECLQAVDEKVPTLLAWLDERGLDPAETVFVGNDVNDVGCMSRMGYSACPSDAHPSAMAAAGVVLTKPGGGGAVRELCDLLLARIDGPGADR